MRNSPNRSEGPFRKVRENRVPTDLVHGTKPQLSIYDTTPLEQKHHVIWCWGLSFVIGVLTNVQMY